jgi:hyaluronoglucosaminidase
MKKNITNTNINGYIEGYYGKLLDWESRKIIVKSLSKNKMNTYFYAPKEDEKHRLNWRKKYNLKWRNCFRNFTQFSKENKINIIAGIAPGLDFNFKKINNPSWEKESLDFNSLLNKAKQLLDDGATSIALLLDDIPDNFQKNFGDKISEGTSHGILANKFLENLGQLIYFVPRIYADELINDAPNYLSDLSKVLNQNIKVFYCGKNVICKKITNSSKIKKILLNKIVYWDNYYANDYCPRRLFIGPYVGRASLTNLMINPTGLIKTDLLILDIMINTINKNTSIKVWKKTLDEHGVPLVFLKIKKFFLKPDFSSNPPLSGYQANSNDIEALDFLLWSWKGALSREWYPYLFGLKHDLQLIQSKLTSERLIKTQTLPLAQYANKI